MSARGRRNFATTVLVEGEQLARLKLLSELTKVPAAVYVREAVDMALRLHEGGVGAEGGSV